MLTVVVVDQRDFDGVKDVGPGPAGLEHAPPGDEATPLEGLPLEGQREGVGLSKGREREKTDIGKDLLQTMMLKNKKSGFIFVIAKREKQMKNYSLSGSLSVINPIRESV